MPYFETNNVVALSRDCRSVDWDVLLPGAIAYTCAMCVSPDYITLPRRRIFASTLEEPTTGREGLLPNPATISSPRSIIGAASAPDHRGFVLKLRGLPYATTAEQVVTFLGPAVHLSNALEVGARTLRLLP